ncbi:MAG: cellulose binding domain-containing protein, partial [Lachnospiraceae bacterium]|nr:cellulose binding domain-containing protein [Lachnospiraceae bacterium]
MRKVKVCPFLTSVLMSVLLILGSFAPYVHASGTQDPTNGNNNDSETERIYEGDGYKVTFSLNSSWNTGYNLGVEIENTGSESIQNWHLSFDYAGEITNIWCAEIQESTGDGFIVKNAGYNMDIAPGAKTSFGISENTAFPGFPENVIIPCGDNETVTGEYSVVYTVENDWGNGFVGNICITNNSGTAINDWNLEFDFAREIISVWGAVVESSENGHYVVRHAVDNPDILPGQSVTIGMIGSGGTITDEPSGYDLTSYGFTDVQIDDPSLDEDTDGDGLTNGLEEAIGTDPGLADTDGDELSDYQELYLTWTDPLLIDTDNNGVSDANEDLDGDGLGNLDEITRGTDTGNPDTDRDDLSDYAEVYEYGTDPLNPDSDGDTLSDGDDVLLGFSPLLPDTDNNGILDCNEIVYQTTENDFPLGDGRGITNVSVSMNISGNIEKEVGILNMYDFDVQSGEVVGIIGVPMEIRSDVAFDTATITFTYDESMLGDTSEEDLSLMWYDEENNWYQILDQECVVDTVNNTVSYTTTHFSRYLLVDGRKWFERWNSVDYNEWLNNSSSLIDNPVNFVFYYEKYGGNMSCSSLSSYPSFITISALHGGIVFPFGINQVFRRIMMFDIDHDESMDSIQTMTSLNSTLSDYSGVAFNRLVNDTIYQMQYPDSGGLSGMVSIVAVNDGLLQIDQRTVDTCVANNIRIYVIDYYPSSSPTLGLAAMQTGGKYYDAQFGIDNERVAREIGLRSYLNSSYDGDEDCIPDFYEEYGMICTNGNILFSDPSNPHSDNDGLMDGLEVEITSEVVRYIGQGQNLTLHYFVENSDPKKEDTDGDGINDNIDQHPLYALCKIVSVYNPCTNDVFLNIDNSYTGGDQHWWKNSEYLNYPDDMYCFTMYPDSRFDRHGCGVIA